MTYTDEHIKEALRLTGEHASVQTVLNNPQGWNRTIELATILAERDDLAARLAMHKPVVDPDLVLADEVCAQQVEPEDDNHSAAQNYRKGRLRDTLRWRAALAGIKAADKRREDGK